MFNIPYSDIHILYKEFYIFKIFDFFSILYDKINYFCSAVFTVHILIYIKFFKMQNSELKKNLSNDTIFNAINKMFISLEDNDIHKTNEALLPMIQTIINLMKSKDSLFKEAYQEIIFLGSFYKGTKIEKPNEFDLNIILKLPLNNKEINFYSERPAFVKIKIDESSINDSSKYNLLPDKGKKLKNKL